MSKTKQIKALTEKVNQLEKLVEYLDHITVKDSSKPWIPDPRLKVRFEE